MVAPELEKLARERAGSLLIVKIDTQALPDLGAAFHVRSIPTMALFEGGVEVKRSSGARPAHAIAAWIDKRG
jgi:thioredoxin 2